MRLQLARPSSRAAIHFACSNLSYRDRAVIVAVLAACTTVALPPQVTVAEVEPSGKAAKGPDCNLPVLRTTPLTDYREVAIIEGLGNRFVEEKTCCAGGRERVRDRRRRPRHPG